MRQSLSLDKYKKLLVLVFSNIVLLAIASFIAGAAVSKARTGKWFFALSDRQILLKPENCKEFSCQGFADMNDIEAAKKTNIEHSYCLLSNPLFGYYNICTTGKLGLSKETLKGKPANVYRTLLVGGSQANINTIPFEQELNSYLLSTNNSRYATAEVFGAAIGGGKQPMQLQAVNALLGMGYEFDSIVNLNGWNEIMLATAENKQAGILPIYPRSHVDRLVLEQRNLAAEASLLSCSTLDRYLSWHPGYVLWSYGCILGRRKGLSDNQNYGLLRKKLKLENILATQEDVNRDALAAWRVSAQNLEAIAVKQGIQYLEVVQPTLSTDPDATECYSKNFASLYSIPIERLLPGMRANVLDLRALRGTDNIFLDCVHLNDAGSRQVARKIISRLYLR